MVTKRELIDDPNSCLNKAAADEPVFLLRAQDRLAARTVDDWADFAEIRGSPEAKVEGARAIAKAMAAWPNRKHPD